MTIEELKEHIKKIDSIGSKYMSISDNLDSTKKFLEYAKSCESGVYFYLSHYGVMKTSIISKNIAIEALAEEKQRQTESLERLAEEIDRIKITYE